MSPKIFGLPDDRPCFSIAKSVVRTETYGEEDGEIILQFKVEYEHWCQPKKEEFGPMFNEGLNERENTNEPERVYPWVEGFSSLEEMGLREDEDADWIPAPEEVAIDPNRPIGKRILGVERRSIRLAKALNDSEIQRLYSERREAEKAVERLGRGKDLELYLEFLADVHSKFWFWYKKSGFSYPEPTTILEPTTHLLSPDSPSKRRGRPPITPEARLNPLNSRVSNKSSMFPPPMASLNSASA